MLYFIQTYFKTTYFCLSPFYETMKFKKNIHC